MMKILHGYCRMAIVAIIALSCSTTKHSESAIMKKVVQLPEYRRAEVRIDSLKKSGMNVEMQVMLLEDSFYPEDSAKNVSLLFIQESLGFAENILYEVRFNKSTLEIISVKPQSAVLH